MVLESDRVLNIPPDPPQAAPEGGSRSGAGKTPAAATRPRAGGATVRPQRPPRRGPKTVAGKARVAGNALTHGLTSARLIVPGDSREDWATHYRRIVDALAPVGSVEAALAERVASALWRLRRVIAYEEAAIAERHDLEAPSARLLPGPLDIDKIIRYEAHLNRQLYQALHELESMRAERRGQLAPLVRVDVHGAPDMTTAAAEARMS